MFWLYTFWPPSLTQKHTNKKLSLEPWFAVKVSRVCVFLSWWKCILHYKAAVLCVFACTAWSVFVHKASMYYVSRFFSENLMCERILCPRLSRGPKPPCQWQKFFLFLFSSHAVVQALNSGGSPRSPCPWQLTAAGVITVLPAKWCFLSMCESIGIIWSLICFCHFMIKKRRWIKNLLSINEIHKNVLVGSFEFNYTVHRLQVYIFNK